jgi:ribosomal protein L11 methylase PrmA
MEVAGDVVDGEHATTRLARAALARWARGRLLDVGTGDGVLVRAALAAGAAEVTGIDVRPVPAVPGATMVQLAAEDLGGAEFDVLVANLPDPAVVELVPRLAAMARVLLLTGVRVERAPALRRRIAAAGARIVETRALDGWCLYVTTTERS